jgi:iron uptake system EfeUOB component EfeO/EfeM
MLDYKTKASLKEWYATLSPAQQKEIKAQLTTYAGTLAE